MYGRRFLGSWFFFISCLVFISYRSWGQLIGAPFYSRTYSSAQIRLTYQLYVSRVFKWCCCPFCTVVCLLIHHHRTARLLWLWDIFKRTVVFFLRVSVSYSLFLGEIDKRTKMMSIEMICLICATKQFNGLLIMMAGFNSKIQCCGVGSTIRNWGYWHLDD